MSEMCLLILPCICTSVTFSCSSGCVCGSGSWAVMYLDRKSHSLIIILLKHRCTFYPYEAVYVWASSILKLSLVKLVNNFSKELWRRQGQIPEYLNMFMKNMHCYHKIHLQYVALCWPVKPFKIYIFTLLPFYCLNHPWPMHFRCWKCT